MNIYFCREVLEGSGLYVIAKTRGSAKIIFANEGDCDFVNVRCELYRKNVDEKNDGIIDVGDRRLKKYDLYYADEDGNEIQ